MLELHDRPYAYQGLLSEKYRGGLASERDGSQLRHRLLRLEESSTDVERYLVKPVAL